MLLEPIDTELARALKEFISTSRTPPTSQNLPTLPLRLARS